MHMKPVRLLFNDSGVLGACKDALARSHLSADAVAEAGTVANGASARYSAGPMYSGRCTAGWCLYLRGVAAAATTPATGGCRTQ
jgi:hypothetical protein